MIECPMCSGEIKARRCIECGWTMALAFSKQAEFVVEKPERPSTREDAHTALEEVKAMLAKPTTLTVTDHAARRAELQRQAKVLTGAEGERVE